MREDFILMFRFIGGRRWKQGLRLMSSVRENSRGFLCNVAPVTWGVFLAGAVILICVFVVAAVGAHVAN